MTTFQTSQLDFDNIKENLKTYLKRRSEFNDYDFEASGLSNILDVLAYNTHLNGLIANFGLNEAYITSAQLRSSVVSIAQTLGYNIRSRTASRANLNLSLNLSDAVSIPSSITIPSGTRFTASVDGVSYTFRTLEAYTATNDGSDIFTFVTDDGSPDIPVYEGRLKTKTFIVNDEDERQVFVIPDETIDTETLTVLVYDTYNSTTFTSYVDINNATQVSSDSTFYNVLETPNGNYELSFGDGQTTGLKPTVGNKVVITYLSTVGPEANSAASFTPISQVTIGAESFDLQVATASRSHGGANRQSIESIRQNAPLGFAAQNRLVTALDYETTILSRFPSVTDVVAWGGEDNNPPTYGNVYVGLLFDDGVSTASQNAVKDNISSVLNENLAVLSVDVSFVDPEITYLEIETQFYFNPNLTSLTQSTIESQVNSKVSQYVEDNLKTFKGTFRKSNLAANIDEISSSILSTEINVKVQQRLTPITSLDPTGTPVQTSYQFDFPVAIATPSATDYILTSTSFVYDGSVVTVKNQLGSTKLQLVNANNDVIVDNIGQYTPATGRVQLTGFAPGVISSGDSFIKFSAKPSNDNVLKPLRNYYYDIDNQVSFAAAIVDRQNTAVSLTT